MVFSSFRNCRKMLFILHFLIKLLFHACMHCYTKRYTKREYAIYVCRYGVMGHRFYVAHFHFTVLITQLFYFIWRCWKWTKLDTLTFFFLTTLLIFLFFFSPSLYFFLYFSHDTVPYTVYVIYFFCVAQGWTSILSVTSKGWYFNFKCHKQSVYIRCAMTNFTHRLRTYASQLIHLFFRNYHWIVQFNRKTFFSFRYCNVASTLHKKFHFAYFIIRR